MKKLLTPSGMSFSSIHAATEGESVKQLVATFQIETEAKG
jgi:hypothetical protein